MPYLDLEYKARTDGAFRAKIQQFTNDLTRLEQLSHKHSRYVAQFNDVLLQFVAFCKFNLAFLTPYYFPRYPKDEPLNFSEYPFAFSLFNFEFGTDTTIRAGRQIAKSTSIAARDLLLARLIPGLSNLYLTPRHDQLYTYAKKLREMERAQRFWRPDAMFPKNLYYKQYSNGAKIELSYVHTTDERVRGKSTDILSIDEAQGFDPELDIPVHEVIAASHINITFYSGTSLTTDTFLEHKYSVSSGGVWAMRCGCGHWNIPDLEHNVLDMIQPHGPSCIKCSRVLDVKSGHFVHANRQQFDLGHYGYHIPQIIVPSVANHAMRWEKIYDKKISGNSNKFLQEVLGIPIEEGEREITKKDLENICILPTPDVLQAKAKNRKYQFVVSGCDWGGSDYNPDLNMKVSTTVHAVVGITPDGFFDLIHFHRYAGMDYDTIITSIINKHLDLNGWAIASDFGVGALYNSKIRERLPVERHLMFQYTGPLTKLVAEPAAAHQPNQWSLNKTESISMTFDAIRKKRIRCYPWKLAQPFLQDFLNMFRAPGEKKGDTGLNVFLYRAHPTKPNDALMAVNYAYMLGKILIGEPLIPDLSLRARIHGQLIMGLNASFDTMPGAYSG